MSLINPTQLPWLDSAWLTFAALQAGGRLPHALLITGPAGLGKRLLAKAMAKSLLCEQRANQRDEGGINSEQIGSPINDRACGHCASCIWFEAGTHPDVRLVRPPVLAAQEGVADEAQEASGNANQNPLETDNTDKPAEKKLSKEISITQIRALADFSALTAYRHGLRVALIYPADAMNSAAANALLKTLEEPSGQFVFLLVTDAPHRLPATLRSRCRVWQLASPSFHQAQDWLEQQNIPHAADKLAALGGAPLQLQNLENSHYWTTHQCLLNGLAEPTKLDAPVLAKQLETAIRNNEKERQGGASATLDLATVLAWLQRWIYDLTACGAQAPIRYHPGHAQALTRCTQQALNTRLLHYWQWLNQVTREAHHPVNVQLFLEDCLLRYQALKK